MKTKFQNIHQRDECEKFNVITLRLCDKKKEDKKLLQQTKITKLVEKCVFGAATTIYAQTHLLQDSS